MPLQLNFKEGNNGLFTIVQQTNSRQSVKIDFKTTSISLRGPSLFLSGGVNSSRNSRLSSRCTRVCTFQGAFTLEANAMLNFSKLDLLCTQEAFAFKNAPTCYESGIIF